MNTTTQSAEEVFGHLRIYAWELIGCDPRKLVDAMIRRGLVWFRDPIDASRKIEIAKANRAAGIDALAAKIGLRPARLRTREEKLAWKRTCMRRMRARMRGEDTSGFPPYIRRRAR